MTTLKFKTGVRYNGTRYAKNQIESGFSEKEVSLFVENNVAFVVGVPDSLAVPDEDSNGSIEKDNVNENSPVIDVDTPPDSESVYKELDDNWTLDELKIDAERLGLDFDVKKILKKDLIKLVIDNDRADEFLAMLEDESGE